MNIINEVTILTLSGPQNWAG